MHFKELHNLKLTLGRGKSRYGGYWTSEEKIKSNIKIYLHHFTKGVKSNYNETTFIQKIEYYIIRVFLIEYICSCIMRGNHFKKDCTDKNKSKEICVPTIVFNSIDALADKSEGNWIPFSKFHPD